MERFQKVSPEELQRFFEDLLRGTNGEEPSFVREPAPVAEFLGAIGWNERDVLRFVCRFHECSEWIPQTILQWEEYVNTIQEGCRRGRNRYRKEGEKC